MSKYTNIILAICLIFLSFLPASSKASLSDTDKNQLYTQMALLTLDCISYGDSLPKEKVVEIKNTIKMAKKYHMADSVNLYFTSLLDLSYLHFSKRDSKKAFDLANQLISRYATFETSILGTQNHNKPTWGWIRDKNGVSLGKIKFSLNIALDSTKYGEHKFLGTVLQEIPLTLDDEIYKRYISCYQSCGATKSDIMYFILRCVKYNQCKLAMSLLNNIFDTDLNPIRTKLAKLGISLYADVYDRNNIKKELCSDLPILNLPKYEGITAQNSWSFCITLYSSNIVTDRNLFLPIIAYIFGNESQEYLWASSRDISLSDYLLKKEESIDWEEKILAAKLIGDSIALSTNILKGMSSDENKYRYTDMLERGENWKSFIHSTHLVEYWNGMGLAYRYIGLYDHAIECFNKAIEILDSKVPQESIFLLKKSKENILRNLAYSYFYQGEYALAENIMQMNMPQWQISQSSIAFGDDIAHLDDMGIIFSVRNPEKAAQYFEIADSIISVRGSLALTWSKEINHYISWSSLITHQNTKRKYINKAENILHKHLSSPLFKDQMAEGAIHLSLGRFYYSIYDFKTAAQNYHKATQAFLPLRQEDRRKTELILWDCLNRIAMRETEGVQTILEQQLAMQDTLLGPNHYDCHQTVKGLLKLAIAENNRELANRYYPRFKSMDGVFGRERFNYGNQLIDASVLSLMDKTKEAYEIADVIDLSECEPSVGLQALEVKQSLTEHLPIRIKTSELQEINHSAKILSARLFTQVSSQDRVEWARQLGKLRSGFIANAITPEQIDNALDFSLFTKGLLFRTNKHIVSLIGKNKQGHSSLRELSTINDSITNYVSVNDTAKIEEFKRLYNEKERDMIDKFLTPDVMLTGLQTGKADVLKNIGSKGLAIDFVKFSQNDSIQYGAFVFGDGTPTSFVSLFHEDELIELITDDSGRRTYDGFDGKTSNGELYNLIWEKLKPYFSTYSDVYFSVDGELGKIGIEYITDSEGRSIGDSVKLHRAFHLADVTGELIPGKDILCMGVANHDSPVITNGEDIDRGLWCNLNCDKEIADIRNAYKKKKSHKSFLMDDEVNEPFVQTLNNNTSSILHLSTHGFYYNTDRLHAFARSTNSPDHFLAIRTLQSGNTSLSGLVLRKGNEYRKLPYLPNGYDDIWTSDEIESLSFPKLQLTVLSACQTGLGDTDSEGVWGLQRAFRIAGTQKLICALDYVNDKRTREFMNMLYKNLSKGISIYDSFQIARTHIFKKHRDDPRMWSAFVLIE